MHTLWSDSSNHLSLGVAMPLGVVTGSVATAAWRHEFRLELFGDASDLDRHALGAALMGVGGVTALGCSMGKGVSGDSLPSRLLCSPLWPASAWAWWWRYATSRGALNAKTDHQPEAAREGC